jgi:hypothetical protein
VYLWSFAFVLVAGFSLLQTGCRRKVETTTAPDLSEVAIKVEEKPSDKQADRPPAGTLPRRMLFIHISRYMYLNPLTYAQVSSGGTGQDRSKSAAMRLAYDWRIPSDPKANKFNQLFVLSDTARPDDAKGPPPLCMKNVVVGAYEQFFETSRAQDRIVVYFGGHVLEKDGKAYIAPIEGDPAEIEATMIPLSDFYDKLKACKATQKVVIWDVCRYNPERGRVRPGSEPMTPQLHQALVAAPDGVEVVVTCSPGENALEFSNLQVEQARSVPNYSGSSFLESMRVAIAKDIKRKGEPMAARPEDPLPIGELVAGVARITNDVATLPAVDLKQTVTLQGKMKQLQTPPDPDESAAKRFDFQAPPRGVPASEIASIVIEFAVPPIQPDLTDTGLTDIAFREEVMKDYKADVSVEEILKNKEKYKFRAATLSAFERLRGVWMSVSRVSGGPHASDGFAAPVNEALKRAITREEEPWLMGIAELELVNIDLDKLEPLRAGEPKRWQAHYDYARAVVKARLAHMQEFDRAVDCVLRETLPRLDMKLGQDGYRLVSSNKIGSKDAEKLANEARTIYGKIIANHKGTPWAIQAKRDQSVALGLMWQPASTVRDFRE